MRDRRLGRRGLLVVVPILAVAAVALAPGPATGSDDGTRCALPPPPTMDAWTALEAFRTEAQTLGHPLTAADVPPLVDRVIARLGRPDLRQWLLDFVMAKMNCGATPPSTGGPPPVGGPGPGDDRGGPGDDNGKPGNDPAPGDDNRPCTAERGGQGGAHPASDQGASAFWHRIWRFLGEANGVSVDGKVLDMTLQRIVHLPRPFRRCDDQLVEEEMYVLIDRAKLKFKDGSKAGVSDLENADQVLVKGKFLPYESWQDDPDVPDQKVPTVRAKRVVILSTDSTSQP